MKKTFYLCLSLVLSAAASEAGQLYGTVAGAAKAAVEVDCGGAITKGSTGGDGSYRLSVPQQGQCTLSMPGYSGRPSATVFSYPNPTQYDFELVRVSDTQYELRRR